MRVFASLSSRSVSLALGLALALTLSACATTQVTTPRSRVAKDLRCAPEATRVDLIAEIPGEKAGRWQVTGCGHTAVYVCTAPVRDCWREGEIQQKPPAP
jgi:hypothetical protein